MMKLKGSFLLISALVALSGCATIPAGPSVTVWPGPGKPFEVFQSDDAACRQWASQQVGTQASESANKTLAGGAAVGTLLGAGLGAAFRWYGVAHHWSFPESVCPNPYSDIFSSITTSRHLSSNL